MPKYVEIPFSSALRKSLKATMNEEALIKQIKACAGEALDLAEANHNKRKIYSEEMKSTCKAWMNEVEQALEKIRNDDESGPKLLEEMQERLKFLTSYALQVNDDNKSYATCFDGDGFRATLLKGVVTAVKTLSAKDEYKNCTETNELGKRIDKALVSVVGNKREVIIQADTELVAVGKRLSEYGERARLMVGEARVLLDKADTSRSKFKDMVKALDKTLGDKDVAESLEGALGGFIRRTESAEDEIDNRRFESMPASLKSMLTEGESKRKDLSGKIKTALLTVESLSKLYGQKWWARKEAERIDKAVKDLERRYDEEVVRRKKACLEIKRLLDERSTSN